MLKNFGINKIFGAFFLDLICFFIFLGNVDKVTKINSIIIPILFIAIFYVGIKNIVIMDNCIFKIIDIKSNICNKWVIQSILYASYNLILIIPILVNLKKFIKSKKQILRMSILVGVIIAIMSTLIFILLLNINIDIEKIEMPIIYVMKNKFSNISWIYNFVVLIAIFSTAISVGITFLNNICKNKKSFPQYAIIVCITSMIISNFGFSILVKNLFTVFGYLGILQILYIIRA